MTDQLTLNPRSWIRGKARYLKPRWLARLWARTKSE